MGASARDWQSVWSKRIGKGKWFVFRGTRFSTLWRFSLLVDVDHPESSSLVLLSLVLHSEDHNFVAWEAIALLLSHLEYQRDKLLHVLLYTDAIRIAHVRSHGFE